MKTRRARVRRTRDEVNKVRENQESFRKVLKIYRETKRMARMGMGLFKRGFHNK